MNIWLGIKRGYLTDWITQVWVRITGKKIDLRNEPWLLGPFGDTNIIGADFYKMLAGRENLDVEINSPKSGLLKDLNVLLNNSPKSINEKIIDFYQQTVNYSFEVWSQWSGVFKPFGWLLAKIFSLRLQQLNVPLSPMDTSRGITSDIVMLKDKYTGEAKYRIWLRKKTSSKDVIYAGFYTWCKPPKVAYNCIKVIFPLPNGNATVIMKPEIKSDGSLILISAGNGIGYPGFYFILRKSDDAYYIRYVKTMRESIHVYEDENGCLRTDHILTIWKRNFLKLHYKILQKKY